MGRSCQPEQALYPESCTYEPPSIYVCSQHLLYIPITYGEVRGTCWEILHQRPVFLKAAKKLEISAFLTRASC